MNKENTVDKMADTLSKELEGLSDKGLHEFFMFFYKMNHHYGTMIEYDKFEEFLTSFDSNPFKPSYGKNFRKQLIDNIIKYAHDHISLITAAVLIKKNFTIEEIARNYYANVDLFAGEWF